VLLFPALLLGAAMRWVLVIFFLGLVVALVGADQDRKSRTEIERLDDELARLPKSNSSRTQATVPAGSTLDGQPYACQSAHYNAATCAEQRRGNAEIGRYILSK